jgi:hypothetical protein
MVKVQWQTFRGQFTLKLEIKLVKNLCLIKATVPSFLLAKQTNLFVMSSRDFGRYHFLCTERYIFIYTYVPAIVIIFFSQVQI